MSKHNTVHFAIPKKFSANQVKKWIKKSFLTSTFTKSIIKHYFLDTFDNRLYKKGYLVEVESALNSLNDNNYVLKLFPEICGAESTIESNIPLNINDISNTKLKKRIKPIIRHRALQSIAYLLTKDIHVYLLTSSKKNIARLTIKSPELDGQNSSYQEVLVYEPQKGFKSENKIILAKLLDKFTLLDDDKPLYNLAMKLCSYKPLSYKFTFDEHLLSEMRTDLAIRKLCLHTLSVMSANEPGLKSNLDLQFLIDYRTTILQSLVLTQDLEGLTQEHKRRELITQLEQLELLTRPVSTIHSYHIRSSQLEHLNGESQKSTKTLFIVINKLHAEYYTALVEYLDSPQYKAFKQHLNNFYIKIAYRKKTKIAGNQPIYLFISSTLHNTYLKLLLISDKINMANFDKELDELFHCSLKLNYYLDIFYHFYSNDLIFTLKNNLKVLSRTTLDILNTLSLYRLLADHFNDNNYLKTTNIQEIYHLVIGINEDEFKTQLDNLLISLGNLILKKRSLDILKLFSSPGSSHI